MLTATTGASVAAGSSIQTGPANKLDRDAFLKLLITELRSQDPLKPMEDKDFIAQLAQFSSLEQMQQTNKTLESFADNQKELASAGWIGKTITAVDPDPEIDSETGRPIQPNIRAKVEGIEFTDNGPVLKVKVKQTEIDFDTGKYIEVTRDKSIPVSNVLTVQDEIGFSAASWLGRTIMATDPLSPIDQMTGRLTPVVLTGEVKGVRFDGIGPLLHVVGRETVKDPSTGLDVEVEVEREVPLANVYQVF